ncbi:MAG: hypothetical protein IPK64_09310 [bacterium]|nr:hypothetical protein [bacterium]
MVDNLIRATGTQGPLFWGAAAAAALGASLLVAALALRLRGRSPVRRPRQPSLRRLFRRRHPSSAPGAVRPVPGGYVPSQPAFTRPQAAGANPPAADTELLLARLRRASDRLAALQAVADDSHLKASPARSDQLYRRGLG